MSRTIRTPHLTFRTRRLKSRYSEQISFDDQLSQDVAQPLFESGLALAAITERADYSSHKSQQVCPHHTLRILLQGSMVVEMGSLTSRMAPGDLAVCPAGAPVRCSQGGVSAWWMYFILVDLPAWEPLKTHGGYVRPCESAAQFFLMLRGILDAKVSHQPSAVAQAWENARALTGLLRVEMTRGGREPSKRAAAMQELVEAVTEAPGMDWDRQTMADRLHVSVSQLKRLFHDKLGVSPGELVIRQRMHQATEQLVNTNRKIAAIAHELGYESLHSFTRLFTKHVGMPPGKYRARFCARVDRHHAQQDLR